MLAGIERHYKPFNSFKQHTDRKRHNDDNDERFHLRLLSIGDGPLAGSPDQPRHEGCDGELI